MGKVAKEISVDRDAVVNSSCRELSTSENEVTRWIGHGITKKGIAREMGETERTDKPHLSHIFQKMPVSDRLELALLMKSELPERIRVNFQ